MSEEGEGGFYTSAQKLVVIVLSRVPSVLPTRCRYYRGVSQKPNSEAISVVPTLDRYYRARG
jgi:predicted SpoU family rRNA methylase